VRPAIVIVEEMRLATAVAIVLLLFTGAAGARAIVGTDGNDILSGTPRADAIFGRGGADRIAGGAGADFLQGGPGADVLDGGPGNDRVAAAYDGARDAIRCGPGIDVVNADPLDRVGADCELVGRRISRDPYGNPESQHQTEVEPDSLTVGRTTVAAFQVGRRFDGGATNIGFSRSVDDGKTWQSGLLPALDFEGNIMTEYEARFAAKGSKIFRCEARFWR
jgi:Ca2+-binding RTX toxin-like protein